MIRIFEDYKPSVATPQHCPDINKACVWMTNTRYCARCFKDEKGVYPCIAMNLSVQDRDRLLFRLDLQDTYPLTFAQAGGLRDLYDIFGVTAEMRRKAEIFLADERRPSAAIASPG